MVIGLQPLQRSIYVRQASTLRSSFVGLLRHDMLVSRVRPKGEIALWGSHRLGVHPVDNIKRNTSRWHARRLSINDHVFEIKKVTKVLSEIL